MVSLIRGCAVNMGRFLCGFVLIFMMVTSLCVIVRVLKISYP